MSVVTGQDVVVRFAEFEIDLRSGELRINGISVKLQPQPAKILALLVRRRGETVTRDKIIEEVWGSDTFVDYEGGLNFAIRQIRSALGDDAERPLYVETIPKRGYRFVGPVVADMPPVSGTRPYGRIIWISALSCAVVVGSLFALNIGGVRERLKLSGRAHQAPSDPPVNVRRSVAVLGFKNLSQRRDAAWLSTALAEMLTTELGAGERLRTISEENVARAKNDLSLVDTDVFARDTLQRVRQNLGTDLVLAGSYTDLGSRSGGQVRIDFRVQDAASGETIASIAEVGTENELFQLIAHAGSDLRARIGVGEISPMEQASVRASYPSTPQAARIYAEGSEKLRLYDAIAAKALLEKAVALDPKYPLAHSALAMAWAALGYDKRAADEAKTAFELSGNLSREERLLVEGQYRELNKQWPLAIDIYRTVFGFFPDNLEYGLRLAAAQSSGGKPQDALSTLTSLRKLPSPLGDDPRIDREESQAFNFLGDYKQQLAAASTTVQKAEVRGARLLVASAQLGKCYSLAALGTNKEARPQCENAKRTYASVGIEMAWRSRPTSSPKPFSAMAISLNRKDSIKRLWAFLAKQEIAGGWGPRCRTWPT